MFSDEIKSELREAILQKLMNEGMDDNGGARRVLAQLGLTGLAQPSKGRLFSIERTGEKVDRADVTNTGEGCRVMTIEGPVGSVTIGTTQIKDMGVGSKIKVDEIIPPTREEHFQVYTGPTERASLPAPRFASFDRLPKRGLIVAKKKAFWPLRLVLGPSTTTIKGGTFGEAAELRNQGYHGKWQPDRGPSWDF